MYNKSIIYSGDFMTEQISFQSLRKKYPVFRYKSYSLSRDNENIYISYNFETDNLTSFKPEIRIDIRNLPIANPFDSSMGKDIVFLLGMVEAVSYLKATCSPVLKVECGCLTENEKLWWKKLYYNGLGEFFYKNKIDVSFENFLTIETKEEKGKNNEACAVNMGERSVVPVGGGKDSAVTAEIVKKNHPHILFLTVNSQQARTDTVLSAGYSKNDIIKTYRKISPELLELNRRGFLNGHTPFSAIVAFLSYYCAYITGSKNIILSNEASANESNIEGLSVNHQYSKSYEFENDFTSYIGSRITDKIRYFSILRPFNELQIAKEFCRHESYLYKFRSCNAGSKENKWCCKCPKCLFVFGILSAFLSIEKLTDIFGENLLDKEEMENDFKGLVGLSLVKPFECVGTAKEIKYALSLCTERLIKEGKQLPCLLKLFSENFNIDEILKEPVLKEFNGEHNIPAEFLKDIDGMYEYVSGEM